MPLMKAKGHPKDCRQGGNKRVARLVSLLTTLLVFSVPAWIVGAEPNQTVPGITAHLQYRELDFAPMAIEIPVKKDDQLVKDPQFRGRRIFHGIFQLGADTNFFIPFAWDIEGAVLYADLNRNRDLTDDPNGRLVTKAGSVQLFRDLHLQFRSGSGDYQVLVDAHIFEQGGRGQVRAFFYVRSLWDGSVELRGKKWYIAVIDRPDGKIGRALSEHVIADRMIMRPWADRDKASIWWHATLKEIHGFSHIKLVPTCYRWAGNAEVFDAFNLPANLFLDHQAYRLEYQVEATNGIGQLALKFQPSNPPLGTIRLQGEFLRQVVLDPGTNADGYTALLETPGNEVELPIGHYPMQLALLQREGHTNVAVGVATNVVTVTDRSVMMLDIGGPLTNGAKMNPPVFGNVPFEYSLVNGAGIEFRLAYCRESDPPRIEIRQGDTVVNIGTFSYG